MPPEERWGQRRHFPVLARRLHARPGSLLPLTDFVGRDGERHLIEGEVMDGVVRHVDVVDVAPQRATDEEGGRSDLLDLPHHLPIGSDHLHLKQEEIEQVFLLTNGAGKAGDWLQKPARADRYHE
jgi:hypothetical protein